MKKFFLSIILIIGFYSIENVSAQAIYSLEYDFYEHPSSGNDQGPIEVHCTFNETTLKCNLNADLYASGNRYEYEFNANWTIKDFFLRFYHGGLEEFNYVNDIRNSYTLSSYYYKRYKLRPGVHGPRYATYDDVQFFSVRIWPKNLRIESVTGPENGNTLSQNEKTTVSATAGFAPDAYTWKYQISDDPNNWINLPSQFQNKSSISFSGKDLFDDNYFNLLLSNNSYILISVWAKNNKGEYKMDAKEIGEAKKLTLKYDSPKIISITPLNAKCFESETTSIIVQFDKPFISGSFVKVLNTFIGSDSYINIRYDSLNAANQYILNDVFLNKNYSIQLKGYYNSANAALSKYYVKETVLNYNTANLLPEKLQVQLNNYGVYCNAGQDARLTAQAKGGTSPYTLTFSNSTNVTIAMHQFSNANTTQWMPDPVPVQNLSTGLYKLQGKDRNGCDASAVSVTIVQPPVPLRVSSKTLKDATGFGLHNGEVEITLTGGTSGGSNGYGLPKLRSQEGVEYASTFKSASGNAYTFLFDQLPATNYSFRAEDQNFTMYQSDIRDSAGCLAKETLTIIQPPPLLLTLEQTQTIRCNKDQTAALAAHATGGKRFVTGKPYLYSWFYSKDGVAAYTPLTITDSLLQERPAGFYRLTVRDENNNTTTAQIQVGEPSAVDFDVTVKNVTCLNWTDGSLTLSNLRGGTSPYRIAWPDGSTGMQIKDLPHGFYLVQVRDDLGCMVSRNLKVKDTLNEITLEQGSRRLPHCYGDADGSLAVKVTLLSPPYSVLWNTGATDTLLTNIPSGAYTVQVLNSKNCLKEATFTLPDPARIPLELEADRYLCTGQVAEYDLTVTDSLYQYRWQGPGLDQAVASITLANEGIYTASISDSRGCHREEQVQVHRVNRIIASDFVVSTQVFAGDQVSLVNITQSGMADTCMWQFHDHPDIEVIDNSFEYATVIFKKPGNYKVGLMSHQDECTQVSDKQVKVLEPSFDHRPYTGASSFIRDFEIRPNPSDGHFEVMIRLEDIASVKLRLLDFYSNSDIEEIQQYDAKEYLIPMHVTVAPGTYVLFLETPYGNRIHKIVIM